MASSDSKPGSSDIPSFWEAYAKLPAPVRMFAAKNFVLLKSDPQHPSLHFKKIGRVWSACVGLRYRGLTTEAGGKLVWF